jgi:pyridoxine 5'-phosphate synthase PdxJ
MTLDPRVADLITAHARKEREHICKTTVRKSLSN